MSVILKIVAFSANVCRSVVKRGASAEGSVSKGRYYLTMEGHKSCLGLQIDRFLPTKTTKCDKTHVCQSGLLTKEFYIRGEVFFIILLR